MNRKSRRAARSREDKILRRALWRAWLTEAAAGGSTRWRDAARKAGVA